MIDLNVNQTKNMDLLINRTQTNYQTFLMKYSFDLDFIKIHSNSFYHHE